MANSPWLSSTPQLLLSLNGTRQSIRYSPWTRSPSRNRSLTARVTRGQSSKYSMAFTQFSPRIPASMVLQVVFFVSWFMGLSSSQEYSWFTKHPAYFPSPVRAYAWPRQIQYRWRLNWYMNSGSPSGICRQSIFPSNVTAFTVCSMSQGRSNRNLCATASSAIRRIWAHSSGQYCLQYPLHHFMSIFLFSIFVLPGFTSAHQLNLRVSCICASIVSARHLHSPVRPSSISPLHRRP